MYIINNHSSPLTTLRQRQYTLYVPLTQNDGSRQPASLLCWVEKELAQLGGGLTRYYPGDGVWVPTKGEEPCRDLVVPLVSVADDSQHTKDQIIALASEMGRLFKQKAVFLFSQPVWLFEVTPSYLNGAVSDTQPTAVSALLDTTHARTIRAPP